MFLRERESCFYPEVALPLINSIYTESCSVNSKKRRAKQFRGIVDIMVLKPERAY
jgi:hypothetical protein